MPAIPEESLRNSVLFLLESLVKKDLNFIGKVKVIRPWRKLGLFVCKGDSSPSVSAPPKIKTAPCVTKCR